MWHKWGFTECVCWIMCLMKSRALNRSSKFKSLIRPVVTYGCEAWTLTNRDEQHLRIFERRILRKSMAQCKMKMDPGESE